MEEPLSSELPQYEPELGKSGSPDQWRIVTNFVEPKDILRRFGLWPDDVLTAESLEALYLGSCRHIGEPFARDIGQKVQPLFPFLDEVEGARITKIWETRKDAMVPKLRDGLSDLLSQPAVAIAEPSTYVEGWVLLALQSLIVLELRSRERELGIWEERTEGQKMGTMFALKPAAATTFSRVEVIPLAEDSLLCVPWGFPFREYSKILQLVENSYTQRVIASSDEKMEVVPDGGVLRKMVSAGLVRELRRSFMDSHWVLSVPVVEWEHMRQAIPALSQTAHDVSGALTVIMPQVGSLMRASKYSYLQGTGDYLEMAYSALMGLLSQWAIEEGLFPPPPRFRATRDGPILERSRTDRQRAACNLLPGVCVLRGAQPAWDELVAAAGIST
jgi:hypothetical protein